LIDLNNTLTAFQVPMGRNIVLLLKKEVRKKRSTQTYLQAALIQTSTSTN